MYVFISLLGLAFGSFLNVCVYRLPKRISLWQRSHCPHCRKTIKSFDLVPLLGYVFLGGRCRYCREPISLQYPLVEVLYTGGLTGLSLIYGISWDLLFYALVGWSLLGTMLTDVRYFIIPNFLLFPLFMALVIHWYTGTGELLILSDMGIILAIVLAAGSIGFLLQGRFGFGMGDVKFLTLLGGLFGWHLTVVIFFGAALIGASCGLVGVLLNRLNRQSKLPFGLFLAMISLALIFIQSVYPNIWDCYDIQQYFALW